MLFFVGIVVRNFTSEIDKKEISYVTGSNPFQVNKPFILIEISFCEKKK